MSEGEEYTDILRDTSIHKGLLKAVAKNSSCLAFTFADGQRVEFREKSAGGGMLFRVM